MGRKKTIRLKRNTLAKLPPFTFRVDRGDRQFYDWAKLFDGERHVLKRLRDFSRSCKSMRDQIYGAAARRRLTVTVRQFGELLVVTREI